MRRLLLRILILFFGGFGSGVLGWWIWRPAQLVPVEVPKTESGPTHFDGHGFHLRCDDVSAPVAIQAWIDHRISSGKSRPTDTDILAAEYCIRDMKRR